MRLVFLEFLDEVEAYRRAPRAGEDRIVALNPKVRAALARAGIEADSTLPYFDGEGHAEGSRWLDRALGGLEDRWTVPGATENLRKSVGRSFVYYERFLFAYLFWVAEIVHRAMDIHKPSAVLVGGGDGVFDASPRLTVRERWLGSVVSRMADSAGIAVQRLPGSASTPPTPATPAFGFVCRWAARLTLASLARRSAGRALLVASNDHGMGRAVARGAFGRDRIRVQVRGGGGSAWEELGLALLNFVFGELRAAWKLNGIYATRAVVSAPLLASWRESLVGGRVETEAALERIFAAIARERGELWVRRGVSFVDILEKKFKIGLGPHLAGFRYEEEAMRSVLENLRPSLVVSPFSLDRYDLLGGLCRDMGIEGLLVSHGSHPPGHEGTAARELAYHSRALVDSRWPAVAAQSPWTERFCREAGIESKIVRTGPLLWGLRVGPGAETTHALKRAAKDRRIIVHAGTQKPRSAIRFHFYETPDEYVAGIADLISAVERVPGAFTVVRFRPSEDLSEEDLRILLPRSASAGYSTSGPFSEVLAAADLLASFSSTTIEEALMNGIPVLLCGGRGRYRHLPPGAGVYHAAPDDLSGAVGLALSRREGRLDDEEYRTHTYEDGVRFGGARR